MEKQDIENYLHFTEGYLPTLEEQKRANLFFPRFYREAQKPEFNSIDESSAWTLSALARRDVYNGRRHLVGEPCAFRHELGESLAMRIPLDTWIIGYPTSPNEKLADWFADQSSNTSYRLIVNRIPLFFEDVKVAFNPWKHVHLSLKKSNFNLKHREGHYSHLKPSASRFMDEALAAYRMGTEREFFANLGHPFTYSDGLSHLV